jgi:hypothetical protein
MNKWLKIFVAFIFSLTTSCVSKPLRENHTLNINRIDASSLPEKSTGSLQYSEQIYTTSKLPLEDFFNGVMTGQFVNALKNLDILYRPSNTDNEVLLELLGHGIVPVFIKVHNAGGNPMQFNPQQFSLVDNGVNHSSINKSELPDRITKFSTANAASNVINVGAVIILMTAVIAAMVAARSNLPGHISEGAFNSGGSSTELYELKGTTIITKIDYGSLILEPKVLQPKETVQGLVFFQTKNQKPPAKPVLKMNL